MHERSKRVKKGGKEGGRERKSKRCYIYSGVSTVSGTPLLLREIANFVAFSLLLSNW